MRYPFPASEKLAPCDHIRTGKSFFRSQGYLIEKYPAEDAGMPAVSTVILTLSGAFTGGMVTKISFSLHESTAILRVPKCTLFPSGSNPKFLPVIRT
jgi:hypothetical protein